MICKRMKLKVNNVLKSLKITLFVEFVTYHFSMLWEKKRYNMLQLYKTLTRDLTYSNRVEGLAILVKCLKEHVLPLFSSSDQAPNFERQHVEARNSFTSQF